MKAGVYIFTDDGQGFELEKEGLRVICDGLEEQIPCGSKSKEVIIEAMHSVFYRLLKKKEREE